MSLSYIKYHGQKPLRKLVGEKGVEPSFYWKEMSGTF